MNRTTLMKFLLFTSYALIIIVALYGVSRIYSELRKYSEHEFPTDNRKEIISVSNILSLLYETESSGRILLSSFSHSNSERQKYDSLLNEVVVSIDGLRNIISRPEIDNQLDSVIVLLEKKERIMNSMFFLVDSIEKLPTRARTVTTVLSKKTIEDLENITKSRNTINSDSVVIRVQKKSFLKKVSDVFKSDVKDSIYLNSKQNTQIVDSLMPVNFLTDTIAQYLTEFLHERDVRHAVLVSQLTKRQRQMYNMNDELSNQINIILSELTENEQFLKIRLLNEKEETLRRSSEIAYKLAFALSLIALFFLIVSMAFISREQIYRRKLEESKKYAEELLASKEQLMLTISHDIKAPLSSIIGYIEMLFKSKLPSKEKYYLKNMQISSEQLLELVNKLLDYHKLDSGKQEVNTVNFSPARLMNDIYESFLPLSNRKNLGLKLNNEISANEIYECDPFRIRQILNNLISNAIKFTSEGGVFITSSVKLIDKKHILSISIKDTGSGISEKDREKIFGVFERVNSKQNQEIEGSGLGLAITKMLTELLDGSIELISKEGKGTEFIVKIPIVLVNTNDNVFQEKCGLNKILKLLFIDDDPVLLNVYSEMVKHFGCEPILCADSLKALTLIQNNKFDVVFCDIQMPDMNGFELVERIRSAQFKCAKLIPIVALSARSDVSLTTYKEAGFTNFLAKPFTSKQLGSIITELTGIETSESELPPIIEGFHSLISFAENDKDAARMILDAFISENNEVISKTLDALKEDNWNLIKEYAHKLLPRMRMIGDNELVSILYALENGLKDVDKTNKVIQLVEEKNNEAEKFIHANL